MVWSMTRMQHKGKAVPLCASFGKAKALSVIHKWWHCGLMCVERKGKGLRLLAFKEEEHKGEVDRLQH